MDINAVMTKSMELDWKIESLLKLSAFYDYDDLSGLHYDYEDGEQLFLADELKFVMDKLAAVHDRISYMARPIKEVGLYEKIETPPSQHANVIQGWFFYARFRDFKEKRYLRLLKIKVSNAMINSPKAIRS